MKMVIGGAYQGKQEYASKQYGIAKDAWVDGNTMEKHQIFHASGVYNFQGLLRSLMEQGEDLIAFAKEIIEKNPELVLVTDEVGYGIVPMDATDRAWREACGRVCTILAEQAEEVTRVMCGMGMKIK